MNSQGCNLSRDTGSFPLFKISHHFWNKILHSSEQGNEIKKTGQEVKWDFLYCLYFFFFVLFRTQKQILYLNRNVMYVWYFCNLKNVSENIRTALRAAFFFFNKNPNIATRIFYSYKLFLDLEICSSTADWSFVSKEDTSREVATIQTVNVNSVSLPN